MINIVECKLNNDVVLVHCDYERGYGPTQSEPGAPESVVIDKVFYQGKDVTEIILECAFRELEQQIIAMAREERRQRLEMRRAA
ncbi:hypothetical protein F6R98_10315 [Candidatus Methylospira mobilis]|uniref:Uncharacterized protein n=1 Tax=Candidatus Methylospira mobilis TaxID=1808979 RepID=A0A5Q0BLI4_9GAMM|nr:hypothetical protein [Candidatus Methylospira mobilis]QFY42957.1 hypothetical protein F6R98_10315 [Candidatus Methylospira mobilis]